MKRMIGWVVVMVALSLGGSAMAKDKWHMVGEFDVTSVNAREISVGSDVSKVRFYVVDGGVIINTFVVRQGSTTTSYTVGRKLQKDQSQDVDVGSKSGVTGLRVSEDGRGRYRIYVQH